MLPVTAAHSKMVNGFPSCFNRWSFSRLFLLRVGIDDLLLCLERRVVLLLLSSYTFDYIFADVDLGVMPVPVVTSAIQSE